MSWDKLSMYDRAKVIKIGVESGITNLDYIKETYNKYAVLNDAQHVTDGNK